MANLTTFLARVQDSMILVSTMDNTGYDSLSGSEEYKNAAKKIIKTLKPGSPSRCTIEAGPYFYHYLIESGVVFLCLAERSYPRRLAFQYLEEVCREFLTSHGAEIARYSRPYAAVQFDPKLNKLRREFFDPQSPGNLKKLNAEIHEIQSIMQQNIQEVLQRGEKLDLMESRSQSLRNESKKFEKMGKYLHLQAMYKKYGPIVAMGLMVMGILYWRFFK